MAELLNGVCSLGFEQQEFARLDGAGQVLGKTLWLEITDQLRQQLPANVLRGFGGLPVRFRMKCLGRVEEGGGHLGMYPGTVTVERVLSVVCLVSQEAFSRSR
jgi:hypothetical protein